MTATCGEPFLVNIRWVDIPEDEIFKTLSKTFIRTWGVKSLTVADSIRYYLFGEEYAYPYSLPIDTITRLAERLNKAVFDMTWYKEYNSQAIEYFEKHGKALNQAAQYWEEVGDHILPKPEILRMDGLKEGDWYIAIIGLFHLTGAENGNNSHLFIDLIDLAGGRIYNHTPPLLLRYEWEGITPEQIQSTDPVRIDKPGNEPGANIGITWDQVIYGFFINNIGCDRFRGIHTRYENDGPGNNRGHHSHYIVLQKRQYKTGGEPPPPPPPPPPPNKVVGGIQVSVNQDYIAGLKPDAAGNVTFQIDITED